MDYIKNPFVAFFPPFVAGILFSSYFSFNIPLFWLVFVAGIAGMFFFNKRATKENSLAFGIFAYIFLFFTGSYFVQLNKPVAPEINSTEKYVYEGVIVEPLKEKSKSIQAIIKVESFLDSTEWKTFETKSVVYFQKDSLSENLQYGDRVVFQAYMNEISSYGNPAEFNYKAFMKNKGIFATSYSKSGEFIVLEHKQANKFVDAALSLRNYLLNIYQQHGFQDREYAVLSALTLGFRDEVDTETRQMFANTGAMHILAVSGLHVGIIFLILTTLLKFMEKKKWMRILRGFLIIFSLWLFAAIAGLSPSVTRSALMFSMFVVGRLFERTTSTYNIIFASAIILLAINPLNIFSVGFQLSYSAVLAIVFFQPYIYKLFIFKKWLPDKLWALTSVSIAAQLGTMPIGLYYFHQFPNYFFLTNILVIPLASIILYLAVLLLFIASVLPFASGFFAFLLKLAMKLLIGGVSLIDKIPYATTHDISISGIQMFILYAIILSFAMFWIYNKKSLLYAFLVTSIGFLSLNILSNFKNKTSNEFIIFNNNKSIILNVLSGNSNVIIADTSEIKNFNYSAKPYWVKKKANEPIVFDIDSAQNTNLEYDYIKFKENIFTVGKTKFVIIENNEIIKNTTLNKLYVDYIILSDNVYLDIYELSNLFEFKKVIFAGTNKTWRIEKWKNQCEEFNVEYFDMLGKGAFAIDFVTNKSIKF